MTHPDGQSGFTAPTSEGPLRARRQLGPPGWRRAACGLTALATIVALAVGQTPTIGFGAGVGAPRLANFAASGVYRWGSYDPAPAVKQALPTAVTGLANVVAVRASNDSSYALECVGGANACPTDGNVWAWGNNDNGQLGDGTTAPSRTTPQRVAFPSGVHIVAIGEGRNRGMAVDATGQAWFWGENNVDTCIDKRGNQDTPVEVPGETSATAVEGGSGGVIWLTTSGTVEQCTGTTLLSERPTTLPGLSDIVQITSGNQFWGARDRDGNVYMWGANRFGQLGVGTTTFVTDPKKVPLPGAAIDISAGGDHPTDGHTLVLLEDGQILAWGQGHQYQLGNAIRTGSLVPIAVSAPAGVTFTEVAAGGDQSFAIDTQGRVWHWGNGSKRLKVVDSGADQISAVAGDVVDIHPG